MSAAPRSRLAGLASAALAILLPQAAGAAGDGLEPLRGRARPVVILSDRRDDPRIARQKAMLDGPGARERDIAVLSEDDRQGALHRRFGIGTGFAVVLVGKDGGVKTVWREPVDSRRIFTVIDAMPMRRKEMNG